MPRGVRAYKEPTIEEVQLALEEVSLKEQEDVVKSLPSVRALMEYRKLLKSFKSDSLVEVLTTIENEDGGQEDLQEFIDKHGLDWDLSSDFVDDRPTAAISFVKHEVIKITSTN